jgi:hypothetical protein
MSIKLPIPNDITQYSLNQLLREILRRAFDVSINPAVANVGIKVVGNDITIATAGNGLILSTRDGLHTYRVLMENNGALSADQIS